MSRSGYYAWRLRQASQRQRDDEKLLKSIRRLFEVGHGTYGSPRIHELLRREGIRTGRKRVARLMRVHGLKARANRVYRPHPNARNFADGIPNRAIERSVTGPDQVWVGDVTYLHAAGRWRFLAVIIDKYSRRVVGWDLGRRRDVSLTLAVLQTAYARRRPPSGLIFHSDHGPEYGGYSFRDRLRDLGIVQSMNRPGGMGDNAHAESFFHTLKSDIYHGLCFKTDAELVAAITAYIPRYNRHRMHSGLGYRSPIDYERRAA